MAPSQLKRLKTSLRDSGVVGPQKSKKQKKQAFQDGTLKGSRIQRNAVLQEIRDQFNPFEVRPANKTKYDFVSRDAVRLNGKDAKAEIRRPGITRGLGEETRRRTLLVEMQRRKKVGGLIDKRFGENDPSMTPEERALQRFVEEKSKKNRKGAMFDLEDTEEEGGLTHLGRSLAFEETTIKDDYKEDHESASSASVEDAALDMSPRKRRRLSSEAEEGAINDERPSLEEDSIDRRKTKKEVMEEVIAKSKLHKYERQQAKEDDDDLRAELDKGLPDIFDMLRGKPVKKDIVPKPAPLVSNATTTINPDRLALLEGKDRSQADREYDERLRQMVMDKRAQPTVPTLTEEELSLRQAEKLRNLEQERLRRMRGEASEDEAEEDASAPEDENDIASSGENADEFGLGEGLAGQALQRVLDVEDEDDFLIDDDLEAIKTGSDIDGTQSELSGTADGELNEEELSDDGDDEFISGLLTVKDSGRKDLQLSSTMPDNGKIAQDDLAFIYDCPDTHEAFVSIISKTSHHDLPMIIQRIRALYHPSLLAENKAKLETFAGILVKHIAWMANGNPLPSFMILEATIRHIHSLAKSYPEEIARGFRRHLDDIRDRPADRLRSGDLVVLTSIGTVFPTSDHFHPVVTPAMLCMTRYLSQTTPRSLCDLATGAYLSTLCVQYQRMAKRYVPEAVDYVMNAIEALMPIRDKSAQMHFPQWPQSQDFHIQSAGGTKMSIRRLCFQDILPQTHNDQGAEALKHTLLTTFIEICRSMAGLWTDKSAFCEIMSPALELLGSLDKTPCIDYIPTELAALSRDTARQIRTHMEKSEHARASLRLHNHRPLAIKTSYPKFEESYNPDRHYDPSPTRASMSKLKAEHKKERKGAMRELRKDASFIARENLKETKEKDAAYDKKFKRLVAEIQGEEGKESKIYEREKRMRKSKR